MLLASNIYDIAPRNHRFQKPVQFTMTRPSHGGDGVASSSSLPSHQGEGLGVGSITPQLIM